MACNFELTFNESPDALVQRAEKMVVDAGGSFAGDTNAGEIKLKLPVVGTVEGKYAVTGNVIRFDITKKPMVVPCSKIENFVKDELGL